LTCEPEGWTNLAVVCHYCTIVATLSKKKNAPGRSKEEIRSFTMSRVRGTNTKIEVAFRKALWRNGIRYRKNYKVLPGKPDIAITKHKIAIFCDGEFWHGKDWHLVREKLLTRREYWIQKIERTIDRDTSDERRLTALGWTIMRFWGRDIEKNLDLCVAEVKEAILRARVDSAAYAYEQDYAEFDDLAAAEQPPEYDSAISQEL